MLEYNPRFFFKPKHSLKTVEHTELPLRFGYLNFAHTVHGIGRYTLWTGDACCGELTFPISVPSETRTLVNTPWWPLIPISRIVVVRDFRKWWISLFEHDTNLFEVWSRIGTRHLWMWREGTFLHRVPASIEVIGAVVLTLCLIGDSPGDFSVFEDLAVDKIRHWFNVKGKEHKFVSREVGVGRHLLISWVTVTFDTRLVIIA